MRTRLVVWAGNSFDGPTATDHHLVLELAEHHDLLWVDPPCSILRRRSGTGLVEAGPGLHVLRVLTPPGPSRRGGRRLAHGLVGRAVASALRRLGARPGAHLGLSPRAVLPTDAPALLHVTDDWVAGAGLMGLDARWVAGILDANLATARSVSAVTPTLAETMEARGHRPVRVIPNGCPAWPDLDVRPSGKQPSAILLGQLNERIDLEILRAVLDAGVPLDVVGPRVDRGEAFSAALDSVLGHDLVTYRGRVPHTSVPGLLAGATVGLSPYTIDEFNRASFPLKTLEYLAAGLPTVSTPLEAVDWLATDLVDVATSPADFAHLVRGWADGERDPEPERRRAFAARHTWAARAEQLLAGL